MPQQRAAQNLVKAFIRSSLRTRVLGCRHCAVRRNHLLPGEHGARNNLSWHIPRRICGGRGGQRGNRPGTLWSGRPLHVCGLCAVIRCGRVAPRGGSPSAAAVPFAVTPPAWRAARMRLGEPIAVASVTRRPTAEAERPAALSTRLHPGTRTAPGRARGAGMRAPASRGAPPRRTRHNASVWFGPRGWRSSA